MVVGSRTPALRLESRQPAKHPRTATPLVLARLGEWLGDSTVRKAFKGLQPATYPIMFLLQSTLRLHRFRCISSLVYSLATRPNEVAALVSQRPLAHVPYTRFLPLVPHSRIPDTTVTCVQQDVEVSTMSRALFPFTLAPISDHRPHADAELDTPWPCRRIRHCMFPSWYIQYCYAIELTGGVIAMMRI